MVRGLTTCIWGVKSLKEETGETSNIQRPTSKGGKLQTEAWIDFYVQAEHRRYVAIETQPRQSMIQMANSD
jgi:hypothetical protein